MLFDFKHLVLAYSIDKHASRGHPMAHTGPSLIDEFNLLKTFLGQQKVAGRDITNAVVMQHNQFLLTIKGLARIDLEVANSYQNVIASDAL